MTKTKNLFITVVMAAILLFSGLIPFGASNLEANALSPDYDDDLNTIYYFFDYYPSVDYETLNDEYGSNYNIVYDRINSYNLSTIFYSGYFSGFDANSVVIIDIKLIKPQEYVLFDLFNILKNEGCQTVFVSTYSATDFSNYSFTENVDQYFVSDFGRLRSFIFNMLLDMEMNNVSLSDRTFLIDGSLVYANDFTEDGISPYDEYTFLRILLEELTDQMVDQHYNLVGGDYAEIAWQLNDICNINLIVHAGGDQYVDIIKGNTYYNVTEIGDLQIGELTWEYICAVGFWQLDSAFYNFLFNEQISSGLPVYIMETEPIIYGSGLSIITDSDLIALYGIRWNEPALFLEALWEMGLEEP